MSKNELVLKLKELSENFDSALEELSSNSFDRETFNKLLTIDKEIYNIYKLLESDSTSND